jgi:hypothetical protein
MSFQVGWKFRVKSWKRNIPSSCIILITIWVAFRVCYYALQNHALTRDEEAPQITMFLWIKLFAVDLSLTTVFLLVKAWMQVIRDIVFKFAYNGEKIIVSSMDVFILAFLFILYGCELAAVISTSYQFHSVEINRNYW